MVMCEVIREMVIPTKTNHKHDWQPRIGFLLGHPVYLTEFSDKIIVNQCDEEGLEKATF